MSQRPVPLETRFWQSVNKRGPDECWEWTAARLPRGYGQIAVRNDVNDFTQTTAHRVSWELHFGPIPAGLFVLHSCDNPPCVDPSHLRVGSQADNVLDMVSRLRCKAQKVTPEQVHEIRAARQSGDTLSAIAVRYGVGTSAIHSIVTRQTWRHVPDEVLA